MTPYEEYCTWRFAPPRTEPRWASIDALALSLGRAYVLFREGRLHPMAMRPVVVAP